LSRKLLRPTNLPPRAKPQEISLCNLQLPKKREMDNSKTKTTSVPSLDSPEVSTSTRKLVNLVPRI
jgi:hypothetical protein